MLETAERLTAEEREPSLQLYLLVVGALRRASQAASTRDPSLVLDAFLLRALSVAGYAPALDDCARCGAPGPHRAFAVPGGRRGLPGLPSARRRRAGARDVRPARRLLDGRLGRRRRRRRAHRREASGLVAAYLQWHLERALRSLPLVERA